MNQYVLLGAGTIGRVVARELGSTAVCFADNDQKKWGQGIEDLLVLSPEDAQREYPHATWIATALRTPFRAELEAQVAEMGVPSMPLWDYLKVFRTPLDHAALDAVLAIIPKDESGDETSAVLWDQYEFRLHGSKHIQRPHDEIKDVYFPDFIAQHTNEVFVDCGAADGDTVREVLKRWSSVEIISIEPDPKNYDAFQGNHFPSNVSIKWGAVSDFAGDMRFCATGDQTSHLAGVNERIPTHNGFKVPVFRLDDLLKDKKPTFIKMDIEGAELEGLWGARDAIRKHSPVLAICAYHTSDHLWQIPLLINAINPNYKLYLRRYLEATWELIWYAVPPDREK